MPYMFVDIINIFGSVQIFLAILGLLLGSFISMLSYRLPRGISILGRSTCDTCGRKIGVFENVPVLYYLVSGGRCNGCKGKISSRYPLIEIFTAFCFVVTGFCHYTLGITPRIFQPLGVFALPVMLLILVCLITALVVDFEEQILPDELTLLLGLLVIIMLILAPSPIFYTNLFSALLVFSFFLFVYLVTNEKGMGFGDVKLSFVLGGMLGLMSSAVWLSLAFISGALVGTALVLTKKAKLGKAIPFGPFLIISAWVSLFFSAGILNWYITLYN